MCAHIEVFAAVRESGDEGIFTLRFDELLEELIALWNKHPHSAMEVLEFEAASLPFNLAKRLVNRAVSHWKTRDNYHWDAGGHAGHCYLSALAMTGNISLAEPELFEAHAAESHNIQMKRLCQARDSEEKRVAYENAIRQTT